MVRARLGELKQGQVRLVYDQLSEDYHARLPYSQFQALVQAHPGLQSNVDSTFWSRSVNNNTATLKGVLTGGTPPPEQVTIELIQENGSWKISKIEFGSENKDSSEIRHFLPRAA